MHAHTPPFTLPDDAVSRKAIPLASGLLDYFPNALIAVASLSFIANEQHNPGEPLHWNRAKSTDHDDCLMRHFMARGTVDTDGIRHRAKVAWRALAALEEEVERGYIAPSTTVETIECGGCAPPVQATPRQIYEDALSTALGQDAKLDGIPAESSYLASFSPNADLLKIGIGDVEPRHVMAAEALRDHDERLFGGEDRL